MVMGNAKTDYDDTALIDDHEDADEETEEEKDSEEEKEEDAEDDATDEDAESDEDEGTEEEDDSEGTEGTGDKKVNKIVSLKREIKEAKARIQELERKKEDEALDEVAETKRKAMIDEGYSEKDVDEIILIYKENAILKQNQEKLLWKELEGKHPLISKYKEQILEVKKTLPDATIEDIYLTKFSKESKYDEKTRIEQEIAYKTAKAKEKGKSGMSGGGASDHAVVKLSPSDERAYQIAIKGNPSLTRKAFKALDEEEELS